MRYGGHSDWMVGVGATQAAASPCVDVTGPPRGWRVTLLPVTKPDGTRVTEALGDMPRALVEYGVQNIATSAVVDWPFQGTRFDILAGALRVSGLATPGAAVPGRGTSSQSLRFRAWAAPYYGDEPATTTIIVGSVPTVTQSAPAPVPVGAREVVVWADSDASVSDVVSPEAIMLMWFGPGAVGVVQSRYLTALDTNNISPVPAGFAPFVGEDSPTSKFGYYAAVPSLATQVAVWNPGAPGAGNLINVCLQFRCGL